MSHSEKNGRTLPIRSPELKSEIAANTGLNHQHPLRRESRASAKLAEGEELGSNLLQVLRNGHSAPGRLLAAKTPSATTSKPWPLPRSADCDPHPRSRVVMPKTRSSRNGGIPSIASAQNCAATPAGLARTDCYIGQSRIYQREAEVAAGKTRVQSDAARLRQVTGTRSRSKLPSIDETGLSQLARNKGAHRSGWGVPAPGGAPAP
jgi:hypothetical protein